MSFNKCTRIEGYSFLLPESLEVFTYKGAFSDGWSIYKPDQQIITDSAFFRGVPDYNMVGSAVSTRVHPARVDVNLTNGLYFWLGPIHGHFGHFLLSSLSRLWALKKQPKDIRIAYVGPPVDDIFSNSYISVIFAQLGIAKHRFVRITGPTRFGRIVIAARSFNENHSISKLHKDVMSKISLLSSIQAKGPLCENDDYVYVSKHKVESGVRSIENEDELCNYLTKNGVKCVSPEQMSFNQQLQFWRDNRNFIGFSSSALHVSTIFGDKNIITINHSYMASANHILLDHIARNNVVHIYPEYLINNGKNSKFSEVLRIPDVENFGESLLKLTKAMREKRLRAQKTPMELHSLSKNILIHEPLGGNISALGKTSQSSVYDRDEGKNRTPEGAVSGKLTGSYQCHTNLEREPWWQVEFDDEYLLTEVRLYNRLDSDTARNRANLLTIFISSDGKTFSKVDEKSDGMRSFGGLVGQPYRWAPKVNVRGRIVRIRLSGLTYLHFDQVEIFGEKSDAISDL